MSIRLDYPDWLPRAPAPPAPPPADDHRVEALVNRFIAGKQAALFTAPDAFYRLEGADAVDGATSIAQRLTALRTATLEHARDDVERAALGPRLDLHIDDAMDGIGRHLAKQRQAHQRQIISERQRLIQRAAELEHDNDGKIAALAEANASAALERARMDGIEANSPGESAAVREARSQVFHAAIGERIANGKGLQALALFDRVRDQLSSADLNRLDVPIAAARNDTAVDAWLQREASRPGQPLAERVADDPSLSPDQKAIAAAKIAERQSADESRLATTVLDLDDRLAVGQRSLATQPASYKAGTFATLANAYEAAGEAAKAENARRLAAQEPFLRAFAQSTPDRQDLFIGALPAQDRSAAEAIQRDQNEAFARDAFGVGTALYGDIGSPVPLEDIDGRIRQARMIAARRNIPVVPFTAEEIAEGQDRALEGDQQTAVLPIDGDVATPAVSDSGVSLTRLPRTIDEFLEDLDDPRVRATNASFDRSDFAPEPANADDEQGLLHQAQHVGDNRRASIEAEDAETARIKRIDPKAKVVRQVRVYVDGGPTYMVADIIFRGNGTSVIIIEVKTGAATLTDNQVKVLAEAARTGGVYITNVDAANKIKVEPRTTFGSKGIIPEVYIVGGDSAKIERQMRNQGLDVRPAGIRGRLRLGAPPT